MKYSTNISHRTGVSTFASRTSPGTDQSLQKSLHLSHADKIELKKISSPSENKKYPTAQPNTTKTAKRSIDNGLQGRTDRTRVTFNKWGVHLILLHGYIIYRSFFTQGVIGIF